MKRMINIVKSSRGQLSQAATALQEPAVRPLAHEDYSAPLVKTPIPGPASLQLKQRLSDIQVRRFGLAQGN